MSVVGDNEWIKTTLGDADQYFASIFDKERKLSPVNFISKLVAKIENVIEIISPQIKKEIIDGIARFKLLLIEQRYQERLVKDLIALTFPHFLLTLVSRHSDTLWEYETKKLKSRYYVLILKFLIERIPVLGDSPSLQNRFEEWSSTVFAIGLTKHMMILAEKMADQFMHILKFSNERALFLKTDLDMAMTHVLADWGKEIYLSIFSTIRQGQGWAYYNDIQSWLEQVSCYRMATNETYMIQFTYDVNRKIQATLTDKSKWWFQTISRPNSDEYNRHVLEGDVIKPITTCEEIDNYFLTMEALSFEKVVTETVKPERLFNIALTNKWINVEKIKNLISNGIFVMQAQTSEYRITVDSADMYAKLYVKNEVTPYADSTLAELYTKMQLVGVTQGGLSRVFDNEISTSNSTLEEFAQIFALRCFHPFFPVTSPTGKIDIITTQVFGNPNDFEEVCEANGDVCLSITTLNRFLRVLHITQNYAPDKVYFMGKQLLFKLIKYFQRLGLEDIKKELLSASYKSINDTTNAIPDNRTLHMEYTSSVMRQVENQPYDRLIKTAPSAMMLKAFLQSASSTIWKETIYHALSIALSYRTQDIIYNSILGDYFLGDSNGN